MNRTLIYVLLACAALTGCTGLNISWVASYNCGPNTTQACQMSNLGGSAPISLPAQPSTNAVVTPYGPSISVTPVGVAK